MAIDTLKVLREIYAVWNNPASSRLNPDEVVDALNRVYSQRLVEFGLSGGNYLGKFSEEFTIDEATRTANVGEADLMSVVRLETRSDSANPEAGWREIVAGNYSDWSSYQNSDKPFFGIYGTGKGVSIVVNHSPANQVYRLFYENTGARIDKDSPVIELPESFHALMVYDAAIEAGELIDDNSEEFERKYRRKMIYLLNRQQNALELFRRWLSERKSQSAQTRESYDSPRRGGAFGGRWTVTIPDARFPS